MDIWVTSFACQAGIGLELPGKVANLGAMLADMFANQTQQAAGVWGAMRDDISWRMRGGPAFGASATAG